MEENTTSKPTVPSQQEGTKKDIEHSINTIDENDSRKLFTMAKNRLMNVNHWHDISGPVSATFKLTDAQGNEVDRTAEDGDHFKIDLPATPGPSEGRGHDWVRIEKIEDRCNPNGHKEVIAIRVRPTQNPTHKGENIAHFLNDGATSSFVIERNGTRVTAAVYGRNEVPNTETSNIVDKVRNAVVGATAIIGLANIQWNNLAKGLLKTD